MQPIDSHRLGLRIVLATYSGICSIILFISWLSTFDWVWFLWGSLQEKIASLGLAGQEHCWLCGMSHAFRMIWQGHLEEAVNYNRASLILFAAMLVGCVYFLHTVLFFSRTNFYNRLGEFQQKGIRMGD